MTLSPGACPGLKTAGLMAPAEGHASVQPTSLRAPGRLPPGRAARRAHAGQGELRSGPGACAYRRRPPHLLPGRAIGARLKGKCRVAMRLPSAAQAKAHAG
eukprot:15396070-Alexandrium_andersonii.AAC.1